MEKFADPKVLREWLEAQPGEWAKVIAARVALRVLPRTISLALLAARPNVLLTILRATMISWAARNYPAHDMSFAAARAARACGHPEIVAHIATAGLPAQGAAAANAAANTAAAALSAASTAGRAVAIGQSDDWRFIEFDCAWLSFQSDAESAARNISNRSLWLGRPPHDFRQTWPSIAESLSRIQPDYSVWIDWYQRRIRGEAAAFDVPGDKGRKEDKWLLRQLADATDVDFWDRGPWFVNRQLADWLEQARARAARNLDQPEAKPATPALVAQLQSSASPQASVSNGKLDAGPNQDFDQPIYSGDLADLPSAMRSFVTVLLNSLDENASAFMRSSLEGYREELVLRGTQPIVGTLKGLAQAISREIWTTQSLTASDDPDDWEMRDEREWGAGMGDLFRTFAKYNADLIKHFPLDKEREDLLRATPIDEIAATGTALTEPVALVTGLVRDLHAQGMATDNIVRIMDAHAQYNRDIASLPPPPANLPDDYVTAKRRHVLMTAGFYLHLYSVMGSTASLAPAYSALGTMVWNAAQSLLAFVR